MQKTSFPPIKELFRQSWETYKKSLLNLFLLSLVSLFVSVAIFGIFALFAFILLLVTGLTSHLSLPNFSTIFSNPLVVVGLVAIFAVYILVTSLIQSSYLGAMIYAITKSDEKPGLGTILKKGFSRAIPLFLTGFIVDFLIIGAFIPFIFPVFIVGFLLSFVTYEVVLENKKLNQAVASSVGLVMAHFGDIFVRALLMIILSLVIASVMYLPQFILQILQIVDAAIRSFGVLSSIWRLLMVIPNLLISWFAMVYAITLYKQARAITPNETKAKTFWLWLMAIFGWIILVLTLVGAGFLVKANWGAIQNKLYPPKTKAVEVTYAPSSCGLSIPILKTTDTKDGKERKWLYEEMPVDRSEFYILDKDVFAPKVVVGAFLGYKNINDKITDTVAYPGLNIYCVDNTKNYTLDEFKSLALASKVYTTSFNKRYKFGEASFDHVSVTDKQGEKNYHDILYLGASKDANKLIMLRIWNVDENDPLKDQLIKDIDFIDSNLKYRDENTKLSDMVFDVSKTTTKTTTTPTAPSCNRYNIREGEFASNKCYSSKDYNDLVYYLDRFNSAVFSYNGATSQMSVTCNGSDFFKNQCDQNKQEKSQAETDMNKYRGTIQAIIARGI